jgi:hypothetical protein
VEHAPTPEQCRADANVWGLPNPDLSTNPFLSDKDEVVDYATVVAVEPNLSAKTLETRNAELSRCIKTDTGFFNMRPRYIEANRAYAMAELMRMEHFMQRHKLISQFYAEDEQGKR